MKIFDHPVALISIVVTIVIVTAIICENREDVARQATKQMELQVKLENLKLFGTTNSNEAIVNKK